MWRCPKCKNINDTREMKCIACGRGRFNKLSANAKRKYEIHEVDAYLLSKGVDPSVPCWIVKEETSPVPHGFRVLSDVDLSNNW